jgi:hypothetical protein
LTRRLWLLGRTEWATAVRRWDRDVPMGKGWDHQCSQVSIVDVDRDWLDYTVVLTAFFGRERRDKMAPRITRASHEVVKVRRIQNRSLYRKFDAELKSMEDKLGKRAVELTQRYAWHGSGKTRPDEIAAGAGFMMQYGSEQGFYGMGSYFAEQASYSDHDKYVYRSSDKEGLHQCEDGKYRHLLLVNVLRGNPLKTSEVWKGEAFGSVQSKLGEEFDSVEGGPHRPKVAGPGDDDSVIYVVYQQSQCLPEFIVTYTKA